MGFLFGLVIYVGLILLVLWVQRARWRRNKRLGKKYWGFYPSSASLGNAFQALQIMAQPEVQYVLEEKLTDKAEDDDDGGPEDPTEHLNRQLKKIRRGKKIDRLKVRIK
ncbi:MAG TPA: hypothetical protein VMU62_09360 [Acidobacteriaceae bacterium]|nr:hypothetical protein [Acidobacteriaceae bacterium]